MINPKIFCKSGPVLFVGLYRAGSHWLSSCHTFTAALLVNKPKTTATVIIARWPQVSHTSFSCSTYSRWHISGDCRWSASLWLVRLVTLIITRPLCHLAIATLGKIDGFGMTVASAGPHANKQSEPHSREITTPTPHHSFFTGRMLLLVPVFGVVVS